MTETIPIRSILRWLVGTALVLSTYWNIWLFNKRMGELPPRALNVVVLQEDRYKVIRAILIAQGYQSGRIGFITNRSLKSERYTVEDDQRWAQAQYVMAPWIVVRDMQSVSGHTAKITAPFVIGDFWDAIPTDFPPDLVRLYQSGEALTLFSRRPLP